MRGDLFRKLELALISEFRLLNKNEDELIGFSSSEAQQARRVIKKIPAPIWKAAKITTITRLPSDVTLTKKGELIRDGEIFGTWGADIYGDYDQSTGAIRILQLAFDDDEFAITLAHEIGHAFWFQSLEASIKEDYSRLVFESNAAESFAENFAHAILNPSSLSSDLIEFFKSIGVITKKSN